MPGVSSPRLSACRQVHVHPARLLRTLVVTHGPLLSAPGGRTLLPQVCSGEVVSPGTDRLGNIPCLWYVLLVMERLDALLSLVVWSHRIGRVVAHDAGSTTPAAQWRVLSVLADEGPTRVGALASACRVTQPGMTRLLTQMTAHGLVDRSPDPADERAVVVAITEAGRTAKKAWLRTFRDTVAPWFADLTDEEWSAIETTARVLAARTPAITMGAA